MKVALFGGAFNPVTLGHIQTARFILDHCPDICEVWLTPCHKHRYGKDLAPNTQRLEMLTLATSEEKHIQVFDYETALKLPGDTYTFISLLLNDFFYLNFQFCMAIGMDNAATFAKWYRHEEVRKMIPFIILPRKGYTAPADPWYAQEEGPTHVDLSQKPNPLMEVSSTQVREAITRRDMAYLKTSLDIKVRGYIATNKLYGYGNIKGKND